MCRRCGFPTNLFCGCKCESSGQETPLTADNANHSVILTPAGTHGHQLSAEVRISAQSGNNLQKKSDGSLYVPDSGSGASDGKVKVDSSGVSGYLEAKITGATDNVITNTVTKSSDKLVITPSLDLGNLIDLLQNSDDFKTLICSIMDNCSSGPTPPDKVTISFDAFDSDPGTDYANITLSKTAEVSTGSDYTLNTSQFSGLKYFIFKEPSTETVKTKWYNTVLNNGTIPDPTFKDPAVVGSFRYYISRGLQAFDASADIKFSKT